MNKRKNVKAAFLSILFLSLLLAATPVWAGSALDEEGAASDVIVLLDVSQSVLPYFHDITDYVVSSVVKDFLRIGDTFHLLSFGESTQVEIAQRVSGEQDVRSILARLYLLYPLARNTDMVSACGYLYQYLADLPESRRKVVVLITDGVQNPPRTSPVYGLDSEAANRELEAAASRIRSNGWPVYIIKVPFSAERARAEAATAGAGGSREAPTPEAADKALSTMASALNTGITDYSPENRGEVARKSLSLPVAEFPGDLGKRGLSFSFPLKIHNEGDNEISLELLRILSGGEDILQKKSFLSLGPRKSGSMDIRLALSPETPSGQLKLPIELYFADGIRVSPNNGVLSLTLAPSPLAGLFRSGSKVVLFAILVLAGLVLVAVAIGFLTKRAPKRAAAPIVAAVRESAEEERERRAERKRQEAQVSAGSSAASGVEAFSPATKAGQATLPQASPTQGPKAKPAAIAETAPPAYLGTSPTQVGTAPGATLPLKEGRDRAADKRQTQVAQAGAREPAVRAPGTRVVRPGRIQVELRVEGQNPSIGHRNVHSLDAGQARAVGGGRSDFLVFLVNVPAHAGELHFDGENCSFIPLRPELFPGMGGMGGMVENCLGKDIPMVSRQGYPMVLRFSKFIDPVDKVNRLLHCIETPGLFVDGDD